MQCHPQSGPTMIDVLMIDVDGVLVVGRPKDGRNWAAELEADLGLRPDDLAREFFARYWDDIVTGRAELAECLDPVLERLAPGLGVPEVLDYWFRQDSRLNRGLLSSLAELRQRGMRVHLATNQEHLRAHYLMHEMRLNDHVDGMIYSAALGARKPEPAFFELAGNSVGEPGCRILLVDDTPDNVSGARKAGWNALLWTSGMVLEDELRVFDAGQPSRA